VEEWITCRECGFTQAPSERCLRCHSALADSREPPREAPARKARSAPALPPAAPPWRRPRLFASVAVAGALLIVVGTILWTTRPRAPAQAPLAEAEPSSAPGALDLTGRWQAQVPVTIAGPPPRPALKDAFLETDPEGNIVSAGVLLTDPGRGGAGGGYRIVADGRRRLDEVLAALSQAPSGARLPIDFIPYPPWIPRRDRLWRALEGRSRQPQEVRYLLLESVEDDYLVQAGVNQTGFLSYVFFSELYAADRGIDALSRVIHPEPGSSLRGFQNLVWDFSGSADFLSLVVNATVSRPDGELARMTLKR